MRKRIVQVLTGMRIQEVIEIIFLHLNVSLKTNLLFVPIALEVVGMKTEGNECVMGLTSCLWG